MIMTLIRRLTIDNEDVYDELVGCRVDVQKVMMGMAKTLKMLVLWSWRCCKTCYGHDNDEDDEAENEDEDEDEDEDDDDDDDVDDGDDDHDYHDYHCDIDGDCGGGNDGGVDDDDHH